MKKIVAGLATVLFYLVLFANPLPGDEDEQKILTERLYGGIYRNAIVLRYYNIVEARWGFDYEVLDPVPLMRGKYKDGDLVEVRLLEIGHGLIDSYKDLHEGVFDNCVEEGADYAYVLANPWDFFGNEPDTGDIPIEESLFYTVHIQNAPIEVPCGEPGQEILVSQDDFECRMYSSCFQTMPRTDEDWFPDESTDIDEGMVTDSDVISTDEKVVEDDISDTDGSEETVPDESIDEDGSTSETQPDEQIGDDKSVTDQDEKSSVSGGACALTLL